MFFLLQTLAPWALAAGALGLVVGFVCGGGARGVFLALAVLLASGAAADALGLAPGRYGLRIEIGLTIFAAYALGHGAARLFVVVLSRPRPPTPDWIGPARETLAQAEAFVAAAPAALIANELTAAELAAPAAPLPHSPPPQAPLPQMAPAQAAAPAPEASAPSPEAGALASIVGLDSRSAQELRAQGVNDLASLADLTPEGRRAAAERLGLDEATIDFWSAQARLYAHGVARLPSPSAEQEGAPAAAGGDPTRVDARGALDALYPGERPPFSPLAPDSGADDLTRIDGVDAACARRLHGLGIWTFAQIAGWTPDQARWVEFYLGQPGQAGREHWREQAATLAGVASAAP